MAWSNPSVLLRAHEQGSSFISPSLVAAASLSPLPLLLTSRPPHLSAFPWMDLSIVLDLPHWRSCVGPHRLLSLNDYLAAENKTELHAKVWWWVPAFGHLPVCEALSRSPLTPIRLLPHTEPIDPDLPHGGWMITRPDQKIPRAILHHALRHCRPAPLSPFNVTLSQFLSFFGSRPEPVISLGDVFEVSSSPSDPLPSLFGGGPNGPLPPPKPPCRLAMRPHREVLRAAQSFARSVLGREYVAVHLRRTDFSSHCTRPGFRCWYPLRQLASCLANRVNALVMREGEERGGGRRGGRNGEEEGSGGTSETVDSESNLVGAGAVTHMDSAAVTVFIATDTDQQVRERGGTPWRSKNHVSAAERNCLRHVC